MAKGVTYKEAGLKKEDIYSLVFEEMAKHPDGLAMKDIYGIVNTELAKKSQILSKQGEDSLRNLVNSGLQKEGFIYYFEEGKNWRLTDEGKRIIGRLGEQEEVFNTDTGEKETEKIEMTSVLKGQILETYVLELLKVMYPYYAWFYQGEQKNNERGLDLIANKIGEGHSEYETIGVQIKNHKEKNAPTKEEWLKFLAGCSVRNIEKVIFITTGRLTSEQRREAGEAKITVIQGSDELNRIAKLYNYKTFDEEYINEDE